MTNPRTLRLVTALVERYPEFRAVKPEWWNDTSFELGRTDDACTAPDLTDRRNLAELCDVCAYLELRDWLLTLDVEVLIEHLISTAEAALGLDLWEEVVGG